MKNLKRLHGFGGLFFAVSMAFLIWEIGLDIQREMELTQVEIQIQTIEIKSELVSSSASDSIEAIEANLARQEFLGDMLTAQLSRKEELVEVQSSVLPEVFLIIGAGIGAGLVCTRT